MEDGLSAKEVEAEEAESSTVERREAAKGTARLSIRVRVGSRQNLRGSPGPMGMVWAEREHLESCLHRVGSEWATR